MHVHKSDLMDKNFAVDQIGMLTTFPHWNFQKYLVKVIDAIIDRVCLGIPNNALWDAHEHALLF